MFLFLLALLLLAGGCRSGPRAGEPVELVVFAASSLTDAFRELGAAFEAEHEGVQVLFQFAGSSQLAAQLVEGIPADVFASANLVQMVAVVEAGRIANDSVVLFVSNWLTIIVPSDNPAGIGAFEDLASPGVRLVLAAPGVPVREFTDAIVAGMPADFQARFYANLVSEEENVRQAAAKVALGEADAAIVYTSDVTPDIRSQVLEIAIPPEQNVEAAYPIAALADSEQPELAELFVAYVLSEAGQAVLQRWGFGAPPGR